MTVAELITHLQSFDGSLKVNGSEGLAVEVVQSVPVVPSPAPVETPTEPAPAELVDPTVDVAA